MIKYVLIEETNVIEKKILKSFVTEKIVTNIRYHKLLKLLIPFFDMLDRV